MHIQFSEFFFVFFANLSKFSSLFIGWHEFDQFCCFSLWIFRIFFLFVELFFLYVLKKFEIYRLKRYFYSSPRYYHVYTTCNRTRLRNLHQNDIFVDRITIENIWNLDINFFLRFFFCENLKVWMVLKFYTAKQIWGEKSWIDSNSPRPCDFIDMGNFSNQRKVRRSEWI